MITITFDTKDLIKKLNNTVSYSNGFLDGAKKGKPVFLNKLAVGTILALNQYIDAMARTDRRSLHHVYEWYQEGVPSSRLFEFDYIASAGGLSINGTFSQSKTASTNGSKPFYDKARIMELGIPVTINPTGKSVLRFNAGGQEVFTSKPIRVSNPGGDYVNGSFEKVFNNFMNTYFRQSFLQASGLYDHLKNPSIYKANFSKGVRFGYSAGVKTGFDWITNSNMGVSDE